MAVEIRDLVDLGDPGTSLAPALVILENFCGGVCSSGSICRFRSGKYPGTRLIHAADTYRVLTRGNASNKNELYLETAALGCIFRKRDCYPRESVYCSSGFSEDIASKLGFDVQHVRRMIRSMRVDFVFGNESISRELALQFYFAATTFLDDLSALKYDKPDWIKPIKEQWDGSLKNFYRILYRSAPRRGLGTWAVYEQGFAVMFYQDRVNQGNKFSPFDQAVLETHVEEREATKFVRLVQQSTGIDFSKTALQTHRNCLVYGNPVSPYWV